MSVDLDMALRYRQRARELRELAAHPTSADVRAPLLELALSYERLAEQLEAIDKTNKELAKRA